MAEYNPITDVYTEVVDAELREEFTFIKDVKLQEKTATANGIILPDAGKDGLSKVTVDVPNTYTAEDEGKVVSEGALVAQGSQTVTQNDTYDTTLINELVVNVSGGGGSVNILSGTDAPTSSVGEDGAIYLQYALKGIKNSYGQYINTGYSGNTNTKIVCDFRVTEEQTSDYPTVFGGRPNGNNVTNSIAYNLAKGTRDYSGGFAVWNNNNAVANAGATALLGKDVHLELSNGLVTITANNETISQSIPTANITNSTNIFIFTHAVYNSAQSFAPTKGIILYRFAIYENDVLVHDFVPAKDTNDVACLYDEVAQEYKYVNSGILEYIEEGTIQDTYLKVNGAWQNLIGSDIDNVNTGN